MHSARSTRRALRETRAPVVYACNVATERGETDHYAMSDHVVALENHIGKGVIDYVLANDYMVANFKPPSGVDIVQIEERVRGSEVVVMPAHLADEEEPWRHDPRRLAEAMMKLVRD